MNVSFDEPIQKTVKIKEKKAKKEERGKKAKAIQEQPVKSKEGLTS